MTKKSNNKKENVVLIGFAGCGKSTIGNILSSELNLPFYDLDKEIEKTADMTITQIFDNLGEEVFRDIELQTVIKISKQNGCVIATGGGVVKRKENITTLKENGIIVYIRATAEKIYDNIKNDNTRPLLQVDDKLKEIKRLLNQRLPLYEANADIVLDVCNNKPFESAASLAQLIQNHSTCPRTLNLVAAKIR